MEVMEERMTKQNRTHSCSRGAYNLRETHIADGISSYLKKKLRANILTSVKNSVSMEEGWADGVKKYT